MKICRNCWNIRSEKCIKCPDDKCEAFFKDVQEFADFHLGKFKKESKIILPDDLYDLLKTFLDSRRAKSLAYKSIDEICVEAIRTFLTYNMQLFEWRRQING